MTAGMNLAMTVVGFAVSTMFIVFVCARLVCARLRYPPSPADPTTQMEGGVQGIEPIVVASFTTRKFSDQLISHGQDIQCTVCLAEYQEKDLLRMLPYCGHSFHVACIDIWLKQHSTCPVCRVSLIDPSDRKSMKQSISSLHTSHSDICNPRRYFPIITEENQRRTVRAQEEQHFSSKSSTREAADDASTELNHSNNDKLRLVSKGKAAELPSSS